MKITHATRLRQTKFRPKRKPGSNPGNLCKRCPKTLTCSLRQVTGQSIKKLGAGSRARPRPISDKRKADLARLAKIRRQWWREAITSGIPLVCGICGKPILHFTDLASDHIEPGKMGGTKDHSDKNLQPAHRWCNRRKGSKRSGWKECAA